MKKIYIVLLSIIGIVLILFLILLISGNQFTKLSLVLSFLSGFIVILTILFEGKIKGKNINPKQIVKLTIYGWILVGLYLLVTIGTVFTTHHSIKESEVKAEGDSIASANLITELKIKAARDSIEIDSLKQFIKELDSKSKSIKDAVVDNAIKALDEQRLIIERQHQNIYLQFKNEIEDNLEKIFTIYDEKRIKGFADTLNLFTSVRLDNIFLNKYKDVSSNETIIEYLLNLNEIIELVNLYAEKSISSTDLKTKALHINMFLVNIKRLKPELISAFSRTNNIEFYKDYENINFENRNFKPYSESQVKEYLLLNGLIKKGELKVIDKPTGKGDTK